MDNIAFNYEKEKKRNLCLEKINQLIAYAKNYVPVNVDRSRECKYVCVGSSIFRGCFHPSPVYDLIVGNTKRGRKCNGNIHSDRITHRYLFNEENQLDCIESIYMGRVSYVEFLTYEQDARIGITTVDGTKVRGICEEKFECGRIVSFAYLSYFEMDGSKVLCHLHWEEYKYDENGLCFCDFVTNLNPDYQPFTFSQFQFTVKDGMITSYTRGGGIQYSTAHKKRDASGKIYFA